MKYQSIITPDGLILSLLSPYAGNRHDMFMLDDSGLERVCAAHVPRHPRGSRPKVYGDAGYRDTVAISTAFQGNNLQREHKLCNALMSSMRYASRRRACRPGGGSGCLTRW